MVAHILPPDTLAAVAGPAVMNLTSARHVRHHFSPCERGGFRLVRLGNPHTKLFFQDRAGRCLFQQFRLSFNLPLVHPGNLVVPTRHTNLITMSSRSHSDFTWQFQEFDLYNPMHHGPQW